MAVEPVSINYKLLLVNVLVNKFNGIICPMKAAIASRQGFIDVGWIGCKEKVRAMTMDDVLNLLSKLGYERIDLLKVDIEGAELDLLTKENSWLSKVRAVVAELHPWVYGFQGVSKIARELKTYGFKVLTITRSIDSLYALKLFKQSVGLSLPTIILLLWKLLIALGKIALRMRRHELSYLFAFRTLDHNDLNANS